LIERFRRAQVPAMQTSGNFEEVNEEGERKEEVEEGKW
jgi:hypothetical protein